MSDRRKPKPGNHNPRDLPTKPCAACGRPISWRKKWERDWDRVKYCSEACRRKGGGEARP